MYLFNYFIKDWNVLNEMVVVSPKTCYKDGLVFSFLLPILFLRLPIGTLHLQDYKSLHLSFLVNEEIVLVFQLQ